MGELDTLAPLLVDQLAARDQAAAAARCWRWRRKARASATSTHGAWRRAPPHIAGK